MSVATARLIADGGKSAVEDDFFRSAEFFSAEGVTHTLRIEIGGRDLLAPLKVDHVDGGPAQDATSPYGYPGFGNCWGAAIDPSAIDFAETGLVSIFLRHRLNEVAFHGATERNLVYIADPNGSRKRRPQDRRQIEKNIEHGYRTEIVDGPETSPEERAAFADVYRQTMARKEAKERYLFSDTYFDRILGSEQSRLVVIRDRDGNVAAASIAVLSDGFIHYYLSGSSDFHLKKAPMKNVVAALVDWSREIGMPLNLGGGMAEGDKLSMFKRGFANRKQRLRTSEIVCDEQAYARLSGPASGGDYFPAYRAPRET